MSVAACVLAAGASTRMGSPKAMVRVEGRALIDLLLESLSAAGAEPRYVVARHESDPAGEFCARYGARLLVNPDPGRGMLSSLHVCLHQIEVGVEGLLVAPVDCPRVNTTTIRKLIDEFRIARAPVVVPSFNGKRGHPTLFAAELFAELLAAPPELGARSVVWAHAADRLELPVEDLAVLDDLDSPPPANK